MNTTAQTPTTDFSGKTPVARIASSIPRARLYRLSLPFYMMMYGRGLSHRALRVLHGLIHATCRESDVWHGPCALPLDIIRIACRELRQRVGVRDLDNRTLAAGVDELIVSGLFDVLEFRNNRHWLAWRLTNDAFFHLFSEPEDGYGYLDLQDIPKLRTIMDFQMHDQLGVSRAMKSPSVFRDLAEHERWEMLSRAVVKALHRTAGLFDCGFLVLLECHGSRIGIDKITIRMRLPHTRWGGRIVQRSTETAQVRKVLLVDEKRCEEIAGAATYEEVKTFFAKEQRKAA